MPDLVQHADKPELTVTIGGHDYDFGEIPIDHFADLQVWVNKNIPHPLAELEGRLEKLPKDVAIALADAARIEARDWPPEIGTAKGAQALLSKESGQILALAVGLRKFHPGTSPAEVARLYHQIGKDAARAVKRLGRPLKPDEQIAARIFAVLFRLGDPGDEAPKDQRESEHIASQNGFPGIPSTAGASAN
jgi:hypothetical protein